MTQNNKVATVFGGTGFIGRHVVWLLAKAGYTVKVATRVPERAYFLRPGGVVGQIVPFACDYAKAEDIRSAVSGADVVVNCIGILYEKKRGGFKRVHEALPKKIAEACKKENVGYFTHISALGCDKSNARYAQSKRSGEKAILKAFPEAVILRPSVVFGEGDNFFNMFARLSRYVPFLPLIGGGKTKFQPVFVGDVADAVMASISGAAVQGKIYELGGPEIVTFKDIYKLLFKYTLRPRPLVSVPFCVAKVEGFFLSILPKPLLTADQVESLKTDNIVSAGVPDLGDLGVQPTAMDVILPEYLTQYRPGGRFADTQSA